MAIDFATAFPQIDIDVVLDYAEPQELQQIARQLLADEILTRITFLSDSNNDIKFADVEAEIQRSIEITVYDFKHQMEFFTNRVVDEIRSRVIHIDSISVNKHGFHDAHVVID
jgi:hypothetical protein